MASRLTDTTIWKKQKWFKKLSVTHKLVWKYLLDECNHAGVWKIDLSELLEDLGVDDFDFSEFLKSCNSDFDKKTGKGIIRQRIMQFNEDFVWITGFMTFQYGGKTQIISSKNNVLSSAINILKAHSLFDLGLKLKYFTIENITTPSEPLTTPSEPLTTPSEPLTTPSEPLEGGKDKDIDKDKDKVSIKTVMNNTNTSIAEVKKFNTKPLASDFNGLPENNILSAIQFLKITKQVDVDTGQVMGLWEIFKTQKLTGETYYQNKDKVYNYFLDWIKFQKFENGNNKQHNGNSGSKLGTSEARVNALKKW